MTEKEKKVSKIPGETPEEEPKKGKTVDIISNSRHEAALLYSKERQRGTERERALMESLLQRGL